MIFIRASLVAGFVFGFLSGAHAQTANQVVPGYMSLSCGTAPVPCFVPSGAQSPVQGFGTLAVTGTSALVSTLTAGPNSAAWPTKPGMLYFINSGASVIYVCPLGGTCSASTGIPIAVGATLPVFQPATTATVISASTGTLVVEW